MVVTTWKCIGGRLCLDFVNTVAGWVSGGRRRGRDYADTVLRDKLARYGDLLGWAEYAGALTRNESRRLGRCAVSDPRAAASTMAKAAELRAALHRIFKSAVENWPPRPADMEVLQRELSKARAHQRLARVSGAYVWRWDDSDPTLERVLWPVAGSAAELLTSNDMAMIRQCGGDACGWMFLDTSRNHSRQWCTMRECGNRAKVKSFRRREAANAFAAMARSETSGRTRK
jgi:predicted RNA-binding Zn ribbon-like protein